MVTGGAQGQRTWQARNKTLPSSEGSRSSRGPRPLPRARGKASGGLQPRLHAEGRAVTSSLRPQNPERAETRTLRQRSPAAPGARPRRQKESEKGGGGGGGLCTVVPTSLRRTHSPGCRCRRSATGLALARKPRPTGSGSAPRRCPPRQQPPDQSSASPPPMRSFPRQPLASRLRSRDWLESATSPRARRLRGQDSRPTPVLGRVQLAGCDLLLRLACGRGYVPVRRA